MYHLFNIPLPPFVLSSLQLFPSDGCWLGDVLHCHIPAQGICPPTEQQRHHHRLVYWKQHRHQPAWSSDAVSDYKTATVTIVLMTTTTTTTSTMQHLMSWDLAYTNESWLLRIQLQHATVHLEACPSLAQHRTLQGPLTSQVHKKKHTLNLGKWDLKIIFANIPMQGACCHCCKQFSFDSDKLWKKK